MNVTDYRYHVDPVADHAREASRLGNLVRVPDPARVVATAGLCPEPAPGGVCAGTLKPVYMLNRPEPDVWTCPVGHVLVRGRS